MSGTLIIVRHGESEWNALGKWTGNTDVHLSAKGFREAAMMGEKLADIHIHYAYVSPLQRTQETLAGILDASGQTSVPYEIVYPITERDYGDLTGKNKWDAQAEIGDEAFRAVRREWNYPVPNGETLKMVYERAVPFYIDKVVPRINDGQTVLLVGHGNSIRALMKYIESIPDDKIGDVEMILGMALLYQIDAAGKMISKEERIIDTTPSLA